MARFQCRVASDGSGQDAEVVLKELAPFSSSTLMFASQKEKNLAIVFEGLALATHSTNWWIARTAFVCTLVLA